MARLLFFSPTKGPCLGFQHRSQRIRSLTVHTSRAGWKSRAAASCASMSWPAILRGWAGWAGWVGGCCEKLDLAGALWMLTGLKMGSRNTVGPPLSTTKPLAAWKGAKLGRGGAAPYDEKGEYGVGCGWNIAFAFALKSCLLQEREGEAASWSWSWSWSCVVAVVALAFAFALAFALALALALALAVAGKRSEVAGGFPSVRSLLLLLPPPPPPPPLQLFRLASLSRSRPLQLRLFRTTPGGWGTEEMGSGLGWGRGREKGRGRGTGTGRVQLGQTAAANRARQTFPVSSMSETDTGLRVLRRSAALEMGTLVLWWSRTTRSGAASGFICWPGPLTLTRG
jgi:hypothetical protein